MSRRDEIQMNNDEVASFLTNQRTMTCATNGKDGWPHTMPLWFVLRQGTLWAWTFAKSQKVRNLERDSKATIQVEAGDQYNELRGVMFKSNVHLHRGTTQVASVGLEIAAKYGGVPLDAIAPEAHALIQRQAMKRVALEFVEERRATWDHRKLAAGIY
ncbi:pyridoxamine 5'-phosphate oxidase family protein [Candidatus Nanopelagicales bacterium]|nr:pyridoxamine 5'-phosphate oxidase family protein [Candidatus Nanopelagicales bacterium]